MKTMGNHPDFGKVEAYMAQCVINNERLEAAISLKNSGASVPESEKNFATWWQIQCYGRLKVLF